MDNQTIDQMREMIEKLSWNQSFGCYNRAALESRWAEFSQNTRAIIFLDIDNMHALNEQYTYAGVDERINKSLRGYRSTDIIAGQNMSGDEFCFLIPNAQTAVECAQRIQQNFNNNGLSVTMSVVYNIQNNLIDTVKPAADLVQNAKKLGNRGTINLQ